MDADNGLRVSPNLQTQGAYDHLGFADFDDDARFFVRVDSAGDVLIADIQPLDWDYQQLVSLARLIAHRQIDATGTIASLERD